MTSSLSNLINNFSEGTHRIRFKFGYDDEKCETCRIKYRYCDCFLEHINLKDDLMFVLQQKLSTQVWLKNKRAIF